MSSLFLISSYCNTKILHSHYNYIESINHDQNWHLCASYAHPRLLQSPLFSMHHRHHSPTEYSYTPHPLLPPQRYTPITLRTRMYASIHLDESTELCKRIADELTPIAIKVGFRGILKTGRIC